MDWNLSQYPLAWWAELLGVHLYVVMVGVVTWKTFDQFSSGVRPFGIHKLFHVDLLALFSLRVTSGIVELLSYDTTSFVALARQLAQCAAFAAVSLTAVYLATKMTSQRSILFCVFWVVATLPVAGTVIMWAARDVRSIIRDSRLSDFIVAAYSFVGFVLFVSAATALSVWISRSRKQSLSLHGRGALFLRAVMVTVAVTLVLQLAMAFHAAFQNLLPLPPNPFATRLTMCWLTEVFPTGAILLWIMRGKDTRRYVPMLLTTSESPYHAAPSTSAADGEKAKSELRPRAPSDVEFSATPATVTEYSVRVTLAEPMRPFIAISRAADRSEVDRTESALKETTAETFKKTLLIRDSDSGSEMALSVAPHGGEARVLTKENFSGTVVPLFAPGGQAPALPIGGAVLSKEGAYVLPVRSTLVGSCVKTFCFSGVHDGSQVKIRVREDLWESLNAFEVPRQLLSAIVKERQEELERMTAETSFTAAAAGVDGEAVEDVLFGELLHKLEDMKKTAVLERQFQRSVAWFSEHVGAIKEAIGAFSKERLKWSFKPSTRKLDPELRFVATNLHSNFVTAVTTDAETGREEQPPMTFVTVTLGAPAAHVYKGFGARQIAARVGVLEEATRDWSPESDAEVSHMRNIRRQQLLERKALQLILAMRTDSSLCQVAAALADSFCCEVERRIFVGGEQDEHGLSEFLSQVERLGFLIEFESLLSTRGGEATMLGDFDAAVRALGGFRITLAASAKDTTMGRPVKVSRIPGNGSDGTWMIEVSCPQAVLDCATAELRRGRPIAVRAVLFTQGINAEQGLANAVGAFELQDAINREHFSVFESYFAAWAEWRIQSSPTGESEISPLRKEIGAIEAAIKQGSSRTSRNVGLLPSIADLSRKMLAGRCTSCKSAKDRTAMSVTWEHARVLSAAAGLPESQLEGALHAMRDAGVRKFIVVKNTGDTRYAFNPLQARLLPAVFKPPRTSQMKLFGSSNPPS